MKCIRAITAIALSLLIAGALRAATPTTGTLRGVVVDASGSGVAGAAVQLHGRLLPGARHTSTNERGEFSFPLLPPDDAYEVEVSHTDFATQLMRGVAVRLGRELQVRIPLQARTSMEIVVQSTPTMIDTANTSSSTTITEEQYKAFPTTRDFQYLTALAPGVLVETFAAPRTPTGAISDQPSPTIGGSTHLENDYIIEGMSTRDVMTGASAAKITMEFVKEVQVMTGEFSAEYGRALGGVVNVITKSGTNDLAGSVVTYQQDHDLASHRVARSNRGFDTYDLGHDKNDWALSLSGPLLRDRLWAFAALDVRTDRTPLHIVNEYYGVDRDEEIALREHVHSAKLTFAARASNLATLTMFGNPSTTSGWQYGGNIADPSVALVKRNSGSTNYTFRDEAVFGSSRLVELIAGRHRQDQSTRPDNTAPMQGDFRDASHVFYYGGHPYDGTEKASRDFFALRGTQVLGRHELRAGSDYEKNRYDQTLFFHAFWLYHDFVDAARAAVDYLDEVIADFSGFGRNNQAAMFVQDRWTVSPALTVNAGLRWERQDLSSSRGVAAAVGKTASGAIVREHRDSFVMDDAWAPRLGVSWDVAGNGRSRLYASAGRFFEAIPVYMNVWSMSGERYTENLYYSSVGTVGDDWWSANGSPLSDEWIRFDTSTDDYANSVQPGPTPIDPAMKPESERQFNLGYERSLGVSWLAGARVVRRDLHDVLEDHPVFNGQGKIVDFVISNIGSGPYASEFRTPTRVYEALELYAQRRLTNRWQLVTSLTSSRARGDIDGLYDYAHPNLGTAPHTTPAIDDPKYQRNAYGRLRSDRPYIFKAHSSYELPFGLTLSEGLTWSAGAPYSAFAARNLTGGLARMYYLTPRGSAGRTPDLYSLDVHAAWRIPATFAGAAASVIADVFNVTDAHRATVVEQEYFYRGMPGYAEWVKPSNLDEYGLPRFNAALPKSRYFGTPTSYQPSRAVQVAVKVEF